MTVTDYSKVNMKKWSGQLPRRNYKNPSYSTKVFLGGVPWDITEGNKILYLYIDLAKPKSRAHGARCSKPY